MTMKRLKNINFLQVVLFLSFERLSECVVFSETRLWSSTPAVAVTVTARCGCMKTTAEARAVGTVRTWNKGEC